MKIPLKFAELHDSMFLGGVNLDKKLDPNRYDITMVYDRDLEEVSIALYHGDKYAATILPKTSFKHMQPVDPEACGIETPLPRAKRTVATTVPIAPPKGKIKAQVFDPIRDAVGKPQ